ncbi:DUF1176 domain-containing protein [Leptospira alstonii]|uniref:DUF1176 domain-containing protein n=1 Tax=Leptospira alstonii TaxID=28452 RepID=UPI000774A041|nr:DUF1176 domain-containing protein [Leptospira alstonii]
MISYLLRFKRFLFSLIALFCVISLSFAFYFIGGNKILFKQQERNSFHSGFTRSSIVWPGDCDYYARSPEDKEKHPEEICADALNSLRRQLPKDCEYNLSLGEDGLIDFHRLAEYSSDSPIRFFRLSEGEFLGELVCDVSVYNHSFVYFLYDERTIPAKTKVLTFTAYNFEAVSDGVRMTGFESQHIVRFYKPETKEFIAFIKHRGMGDCGRYFRYQLSEKKRPILEEIRAKLECNGMHSYSAEEIPVEWTQYEAPLVSSLLSKILSWVRELE